MTRLIVLVATLAIATPAAAEAPRVARHVLANGLIVLVREDPTVGVVAASLLVRSGSAFETAETAGVTNFLQRAMLRGTKHHSALALAEAAEEIGGALDASGDVDYAELRGSALARHWEALLTLMAEVALEPTLPPAEVERERALILGQLQARADQPFPRALDAAMTDLYAGHPYAWPALGRVDSVTRLSRAALVERYETAYRADRMVLAVAGAVPPQRVVAIVERLFRRAPTSATAASASTGNVTPRGERRVVERDAQQAQVLVGYLGPPLTHPDYAAMRVLGAVLGGGTSSRMFVELRERRGLAYSVGVLTTNRTGPALFLPYLGTAPTTAAVAEAAVLAEVERVRRERVEDRELTRAKAWLLGNLAMDRRTSARHAWYLAFFELVGGGWDWPERFARAVDAVTVADLTRVAERYLAQPTVVVFRPPERTTR
jgi:predicted Zn-dependent peptidase